MTGSEVWRLISPMIYTPHDKEKHPDTYDTLVDAYVITFIGLTLFDNWVANGKPEEWKEQPKKGKKNGDK